MSYNQGGDSIKRCHLTSIGNPTVEIRRSYDRLISTMGFPILVRWHFYIESGSRKQYDSCYCHIAVMAWVASQADVIGTFFEVQHPPLVTFMDSTATGTNWIESNCTVQLFCIANVCKDRLRRCLKPSKVKHLDKRCNNATYIYTCGYVSMLYGAVC